jgi:hypothetical protein
VKAEQVAGGDIAPMAAGFAHHLLVGNPTYRA